MQIELHYFEGCPGYEPTLTLLQSVLKSLGVDDPIKRVCPANEREARAFSFMGSPSVLINGSDVGGRLEPANAMSCRVYKRGPVPERWMLEAAALGAMKPMGILFLCVANSARSQMAEGIMRGLAHDYIRVYSAGSAPGELHPAAVTVLQEEGIDISMLTSKHISTIPASNVDSVVTLCAEEECPVFLGDARRVHWELPDPAAEMDGVLAAFREVRDELTRRLGVMFRFI
jgi:arsenate reductase (thioredoxin)